MVMPYIAALARSAILAPIIIPGVPPRSGIIRLEEEEIPVDDMDTSTF
jgi:hypothetical protein